MGRFQTQMSEMTHRSETGKEYRYILGSGLMKTSDVVVDDEYCYQSCIRCAKLYDGGCAKQAPRFRSFVKRYEYIIFVWTDFIWDDFRQKSFVNIAIFNAMVGKMFKRVMRVIRQQFKGETTHLISGFCRGCSVCSFPVLGFCVNPTKRQFSLEATGILVSKTLEKFGHPELSWVFTDDKVFSLTKVEAILFNSDNKIDFSDIFNHLRYLFLTEGENV